MGLTTNVQRSLLFFAISAEQKLLIVYLFPYPANVVKKEAAHIGGGGTRQRDGEGFEKDPPSQSLATFDSTSQKESLSQFLN